MSRSRRSDVIRERNIELQKQIEDAHRQLHQVEESKERTKQLMERLEKIERDWLKSLDELNQKKQKYDELIVGLENVKTMMVEAWNRKATIKRR